MSTTQTNAAKSQQTTYQEKDAAKSPLDDVLSYEQKRKTLIDQILAESSDRVKGVDLQADAYFEALTQAATDRGLHADIMAKALKTLRGLFSGEMLKNICEQLMNTKLGFMTDRGPHMTKAEHKQPYGPEIVRDCLIEGLLKGAKVDSNEINIIARSCYLTKQFYLRMCREFPGVTGLRWDCSVPYQNQGRTCVRFSAEWEMDGECQTLLSTDGKPGQEIGITVNQGSTVDNIVGKGVSKGLCRVYAQMLSFKPGARQLLPDVDDANEPPPPVGDKKYNPAEQKPPEAGKTPGDVFVENMGKWEAKLVSDGLCQAGEFLKHLVEAGQQIGFPEDLRQWAEGQQRAEFCHDVVMGFRADKLDAKAYRESHPEGNSTMATAPPGSDSPASATSAPVSMSKAHYDRLLALLENTATTYADALKYLGLTVNGTVKLQQLGEEEYTKLEAWLSRQPLP